MSSYKGNGTTIALERVDPAGTVTVGRIVRIDGFSEEIPDVEDSDLSTSNYMAYCPGDLIDHSPITGTAVFDLGNMAVDNFLASLGEKMDMTLTFPQREIDSVAGMHTGYGWIKTRGYETIENNTRILAPFEFRFAGGNELVINQPTYVQPTLV